MPRPHRTIVLLDAEATATRTEADGHASPLPSPVAAVEPEPVPTQPERTPERQRLAEAIERRDAIVRQVADLGAVVNEANRADLDASTAYYAAERAYRRSQPGYRPDRPLGEGAPHEDWIREQSAPPLPIGEARAAMEAAQDAKDTARRALEFHQGRRDELADSLKYRDWDVEKAVKAVIASDPAIVAVAAEARRLFLAYEDIQLVTNKLSGIEALRSAFNGFNRPVHYSDPVAFPARAAWAAAEAALATDPDTPLPAV